MIRAVVIGQSHCNAIAKALEAGDGTDDRLRVYRLGERIEPGGPPLTFYEATQIVADLPAGAPVFLSILGGYHNNLNLLDSGEPYDFLFEADDVANPLPITRVPHRAFALALESIFDEAQKIHTLKAVSKAPVYMLSTPPPKQSNDFIKMRLMAQKKKIYSGRSFLNAEVEQPRLRLKLWRLEARLLERWTERSGMRFISAPSRAFSESGFLRREYFEDATHANAPYGALVVEQIMAILAGEELHG